MSVSTQENFRNFVVPDCKYFAHIPHDETRIHTLDPGFIMFFSDFAMIVNSLDARDKLKQFVDTLDSIPCGINCSQTLEDKTEKLIHSNVFVNGKVSFRTYINHEIDKSSIDKLCFVLTEKQWQWLQFCIRELKQLDTATNSLGELPYIRCEYDRSLDRTDFVYQSIKLYDIFMNKLNDLDIEDPLINSFLERTPVGTNYLPDAMTSNDKYLISKSKNIRNYLDVNGLYPWCKIVLKKKDVRDLDVILRRYNLSIESTPLERNPVITTFKRLPEGKTIKKWIWQ